jgi:hypothetical protein
MHNVTRLQAIGYFASPSAAYTASAYNINGGSASAAASSSSSVPLSDSDLAHRHTLLYKANVVRHMHTTPRHVICTQQHQHANACIRKRKLTTAHDTALNTQVKKAITHSLFNLFCSY